jgi:type IV pilus assembly protein PilB
MPDQSLFLERALLDAELVTTDQVQAARQYAADQDVDLAEALVRSEALSRRQISLVQADICEMPFVDLDDYVPSFANTALVPRAVAERYTLFPLFMIDGVLTLGMDDPLNLEAADQVRQIAKCEVDPVLCERAALTALISRSYRLTHHQGDSGTEMFDNDEASAFAEAGEPVVAAVNQILADAVDQRASDVHINPDERDLHLRVRVDGVLQERQGPPLSMHSGLVQRLKVMAHLDLTQTRRPQDGKFRFRHGGQNVDVRMSTVPTVCGENVVLRLLASTQSIKDFHELGLPAPLASEIEELLVSPYGMLLVTGPTGSGKTTTLYTALSRLNDPSRNIMTIEDPVEIRLPYLRQIQANPEIGLTFATALRSILRQDPDVVLVGEIRDNETATIALQAALTGHFVLSTVHTNDAAGAISRLRDYDLPSFVINSALLGVVGQRLVRRICQHCVVPDEPDELMRRRFRLGDDVDGFVRGKGCGRCSQSGYRGRLGIYELFTLTSAIKRLIEDEASIDRIRATAMAEGMRLMWQDGLDKARLGQTTLAEVLKVASVLSLGDVVEEERAAA